MSALNDARAAAIQASLNILQAGPDTEERRRDARLIIETALKNTKLEQYRVSEVLIPFPVEQSKSNSSNGNNGEQSASAAGAVSTTHLPPLEIKELQNLIASVKDSGDSVLTDADDLWKLSHI